jgi:hypothetical protein
MGTFNQTSLSGLMVATLAFLAACSDSVPTVKPANDNAGTRSDRADYRKCTTEVYGTTRSSISGFFGGAIVKNVEGPVTFCLAVEGTGRDVYADLRVEYEDDFGIRVFESATDNLFFGELKQTETETKLELIFIDDFGMISVKGSGQGENEIHAEIRFYNFLTYEEELNLDMLEKQEQCRSGALTVAQCLGYNFPPTYWWNQALPLSPRARLIEEAQALLIDPTRSRSFGAVDFDITSALVAQ